MNDKFLSKRILSNNWHYVYHRVSDFSLNFVKMSFTDVEDVHLKETDLFAHSSIIKPEIVRFRDKFDYNKLEFDGLIRRNHRVCYISTLKSIRISDL
jgi:hypothetical protein